MYHFIINPASRSYRGLKIWKNAIEPVLHEKQLEYRSYFSERAGDVIRLVKEITASGEGAVNLVILGGDGTVNEALQGISRLEDVVLGYIPTGSSNDLARDLGIPMNPHKALDRILCSGKPEKTDLGTVTYSNGESRRFAVSCGIGFDAAVCEESLHSKMKLVLNKLGLGKLTYLGIALKQLIAAKPASCELYLNDDKAIRIGRVLFVTCMIHQYEGGGFKFCPNADAGDGILELCSVGDISKPVILAALPTAFWGKHYFVKGIKPYQANKVRIKTSVPLWVHTDGEVSRRVNELFITCEKKVLSIIR